jgi:hypothetical protein
VAADRCSGTVLDPGDTCEIAVRHAPRGTGPRPGGLRIPSDSPAGPRLVLLRGAGQPAELQVAPAVTAARRVVQVSGSRLPPDTDVTVVLADGISRGSGTTDARGELRLPLLVLPQGRGDLLVRATAVRDGVTVRAEAPLLVVPAPWCRPRSRRVADGGYGRRPRTSPRRTTTEDLP